MNDYATFWKSYIQREDIRPIWAIQVIYALKNKQNHYLKHPEMFVLMVVWGGLKSDYYVKPPTTDAFGLG